MNDAPLVIEFDPARDLIDAQRIHQKNGLDPRCFPDFSNPLFVAKEIWSVGGKPAMMCFLKVTSELYFLIDHEVGTPEERWTWLQTFKDYMARVAAHKGFDQMTAYVPTELEKSFGPRLIELGFIKSPWQSYTLNL